MSNDNEGNLPPPLSEVGSVLVRTQNDNADCDRWRAMFEQQSANMRALIEALQAPKTDHVNLPEFNSDKSDTDARSWCATADLCFGENPLQGGKLVLALSKALKGAASTWLSQIAYQGMTWSEFKVLFTSRFISTETLAGTLITLNSDKPHEKETLVAYASRLMTSLTNRWKDANKEEIAVATVLAHISQFDSRLQRLAFTTDITTRDRLQQELHAFSHLKRKSSNQGESSTVPDAKRSKMNPLKCFNCGKGGHKRSECRSKFVDSRGRPTASTPMNQAVQQPAVKPLVCFKCGKPGHIAIRCTSGGTASQADGGVITAHSERRVDACFIQTPSGTLEHKGGVWSLRNLSISVPRAVLSGEGESVVLRCSYDLEGAALYSIKWYRVETEFYRYVPREMPPSLVFPLPGTLVDLTQSDQHQVRVVNMHRQLSGEYQCEVSADAPLFHTDIRSAPLTVVDPPFRAPQISVSGSSYARGDTLRANCSVDDAYPAPNITWILDEHKIAETVSWRSMEMDFKERPAFSQLEISILEAEHYKMGLTYTSSNLNRAYQDHYVYSREMDKDEQEVVRYTLVPPPNGQFTLSCVATIFDIYARKSEPVYIKEDAPHPASVTGEDSSGTSPISSVLLTSICASAALL